MPPEVQSEIDDLRQRVKRLEENAGRTKRGRTNQRGAADYLGRSREWLRQLHLRGEGPVRDSDGSYSYDNLDIWSEKGAALIEQPHGAVRRVGQTGFPDGAAPSARTPEPLNKE